MCNKVAKYKHLSLIVLLQWSRIISAFTLCEFNHKHSQKKIYIYINKNINKNLKYWNRNKKCLRSLRENSDSCRSPCFQENTSSRWAYAINYLSWTRANHFVYDSLSVTQACPCVSWIDIKPWLPPNSVVRRSLIIGISVYIQKHVLYGWFKGFSRVILTLRDFEFTRRL
jgi:hypothetical protein